MTVPPWSVYVLTGFSITYGIILHRAAIQNVYRSTGIRVMDAYLIVWLLGFASGFTPLCLYLAFGFKEFADTPTGNRLLQYLRWTARAEVLFFVLYAVFILATVRQRSGPGYTLDDLQTTIAWNVGFAIIAVIFTAIAGIIAAFMRRLR